MYIDVHCHVDMIDRPVGEIIRDAKKKGVGVIVTNGVNPKSNRDILRIADEFKEVKASFGMYPIDALSLSDDEIDEEIKFVKANKDKIIAIGEIGLDLKEESFLENFERQKKIFSKFVKLGVLLNKPVIVHSRKAELETIELLEKLNAKKVVMHCFSGSMKLVERIFKNGWLISIPTCVNYAEHFQKVVEITPIKNLLCETDSPYLHPKKEFPNSPENVVFSYKKIAEIKGVKLREVEEVVEGNFGRVFGSE